MALAGPLVAAIDFGASSIRVSVVDLGNRPLEPVVVHRYAHRPSRLSDGSLRWDWATLVAEAQRGLARAREFGPLASIGIDTWGLDYGLLDTSGQLVAPPHSYRDERLADWELVAERIGPRRLYDITGTQLMAGNTIFQLAVHNRDELARTHHVLMLPELLLHDLCGVVLAERTSAGTTALVDHQTGKWSDELIDAIDADRSWFSELHQAGELVATYEGVPVHLVGGHDTASAVLAMGPTAQPDAVFLSAGTLFLVGRDQQLVRTDDDSFARNISHEPGVFGGVRRLANLPGMWLLEEARRSWKAESVAQLMTCSESQCETAPIIDVTDASLIAPEHMPDAVCALAGLPTTSSQDVIVACITESLAVAVADTVARIDDSGTAQSITAFGGGSQASLLMKRIAARANLPMNFGPVEATTLGNALAQGIALGAFADVAEARRSLSA